MSFNAIPGGNTNAKSWLMLSTTRELSDQHTSPITGGFNNSLKQDGTENRQITHKALAFDSKT